LKRLTTASIPTSLVTDDASNNEPVTYVDNVTTVTTEVPISSKHITQSSAKKKEPTPTNDTIPNSNTVQVNEVTSVTEPTSGVEPPPANQKPDDYVKTRRIPVTIAPVDTENKNTNDEEKSNEEVNQSTSNSSTGSNSKLPDVVGGETGKTTRYWDCCVASCSWKENTGGPVVNACDDSGVNIIKDFSHLYGNVCAGGTGYMCNNNQPWKVNDDVAYGFAAASFKNGSQADWCCSCYRLQFTSGPVKGKQMIVQITNTGSDLSNNHFDLQIPGGGVGIFNGCQKQWNTPENGWGERYGGISSQSDCSSLPKELQDGCNWRFDWFKNADNPDVTFERVQCPTELTSKTGCVPNNNNSFKKIPWN